jgi:hypothetical protein
MYPAKRVICAFGGAASLAKAVNRDVSRILRWTYPAERGGTGGSIPGGTKMLNTILAAAQERGISLTLNDLINPTPDTEIEVEEAAVKRAAA